MYLARSLSFLLLFPLFLQSSWGMHQVPSKWKAFPNQQFGPSPLGSAGKSLIPEVSPEVQADLDRLRGQKSAENIVHEISLGTGLAHSVAYMKLEIPGATLEDKARIFLEDYSNLFLKGRSTENLVHEKTRVDSLGSQHVDFLQYHQGLRVYGAGLTAHFDPEDNLVMVNGEYIPRIDLDSDLKTTALTEDEALYKSLRRLGPFPWKRMEPGELVVYAKYPGAKGNYLAYRYDLIGNGFGSHHILFADATDGTPLAFFPTAAYLDGTANVFEPNPVDNPNPVQRTITGLDDSGFLRGPLNVLVDEESPRVQSANREFLFDPSTEDFNQANVFYYLTETRRRLRELGFDDTSQGVIPVITNAKDKKTGGEFNNAFYSGISKGFVFGNGDGNLTQNLSRDFDVATHEFGHFFDDFLINTENTAPHTPRRAWGEACGDTVAISLHGGHLMGESTIPVPGGGAKASRNLDNTKRFPGDLVNSEHLDGEILGGSNYDFIKLLGGGVETQAARDEMIRVLIAGIPHIPPANVQFSDILAAFVQGDMARTGGAHAQNLRTAFGMHGITEGGIQKIHQEKMDTEEPPDPKLFFGYQEIFEGIPITGTLSNGFFANFYVRLPPGSTLLTIETFAPRMPEVGDVSLFVAPANFAPGQFYDSQIPNTVFETIGIIDAPPIFLNQDSVWLIEVREVFDFFSFSEVGLRVTIDSAEEGIVELEFNISKDGRIETKEDVDYYFFNGTQNQVIDLAVNKRGDNTLDPLIALANSQGQLIAFDDDTGGNGNSIISGFTLPANDNYLVAVQSAFTDFGPTSLGDYSILLSGGTAPGPTPTPPPAGEGIPLADGVPTTGTIPPSNPQAGAVSVSDQYRITVPDGAEQLTIEVGDTPIPLGSMIVQVRQGQPIGNTLDDYVGLGGRKSTVIVTPDSGKPLTPGDYFILIFNTSPIAVNFQLIARIDTGGGSMTGQFDSDSNGTINAIDLISFIQSNPSDLNDLFVLSSLWSGPVP